MPANFTPPERCWSIIGVFGELTCPELTEHVHCRNCPVFRRAGRRLLERRPPAGYTEEWTRILAEAKRRDDPDTVGILVFSLAGEWFGLKTAVIQEIVTMRPIRRVPHLDHQVILGLVNVQGELLLAISLATILGVADKGDGEPAADTVPRLLAAVIQGERWVFPVNSVTGVHRVNLGHLTPVPATLSRSADTHSLGLFSLADRTVACLDETLVRQSILRSLP